MLSGQHGDQAWALLLRKMEAQGQWNWPFRPRMDNQATMDNQPVLMNKK